MLRVEALLFGQGGSKAPRRILQAGLGGVLLCRVDSLTLLSHTHARTKFPSERASSRSESARPHHLACSASAPTCSSRHRECWRAQPARLRSEARGACETLWFLGACVSGTKRVVVRDMSLGNQACGLLSLLLLLFVVIFTFLRAPCCASERQ